MRKLVFLALVLLLSGCIIGGEPENATENQTETNESAVNETEVQMPLKWERYYAEGFSFEYPSDMDTQDAAGLFSGERVIEGQTMELMILMYFNASDVYGFNQDKIFQETPSEAATDLLLEDMEDDLLYILDDAEEIGNITEFSIGRDAFVSYVQYETQFFEKGKTYYGHAVSIYIPERSQHIKVRIIARNPDIADQIKATFLTSFRLE